jgi:hypothetical protein
MLRTFVQRIAPAVTTTHAHASNLSLLQSSTETQVPYKAAQGLGPCETFESQIGVGDRRLASLLRRGDTVYLSDLWDADRIRFCAWRGHRQASWGPLNATVKEVRAQASSLIPGLAPQVCYAALRKLAVRRDLFVPGWLLDCTGKDEYNTPWALFCAVHAGASARSPIRERFVVFPIECIGPWRFQ